MGTSEPSVYQTEAQAPDKPTRKRGKFVPSEYGTRIDALTDVIRFAPELFKGKPSVFLALLFHAERSVVYGKASDATSLTQMANGVYDKHGRRIRGSAGISKASCAAANLELEKQGLIKRTARHRPDGRCDWTEYEIQWPKLAELFVKVIPEEDTRHCPVIRQSTVQPLDSGTVQYSDIHCPAIGQETEGILQTSSSSQRKSKQKGASVRRSAVVDSANKPPPQSEKPKPKTEDKTKTFSSLKSDDDEPQHANPKDELVAICHRIGTPLTMAVINRIDKNLNKYHPPITWGQLLDAAKEHLRNPALRNPLGFLTELSKSFQSSTETLRPAPPPPPPPEICDHCHEEKGRGAYLEDGRIVPCPVCATPEWKAQIEAVNARDAAKRRAS